MVPILNVLVPRFTVDDEDGGCCTKPELEFLEIILILLPVSALLYTKLYVDKLFNVLLKPTESNESTY